MLRLVVNIAVENECFHGEDGPPALAKVLREIAARIESSEHLQPDGHRKVYDGSGNVCGRWGLVNVAPDQYWPKR